MEEYTFKCAGEQEEKEGERGRKRGRERGRERELAEVDIQCFLSLSTLYLKIRSLTEPRVHCFI